MDTSTIEASVQVSTREADTVDVSIVIPCLNESRTVGRCVEKALRALEHLGVTAEAIVADNGSSDTSAREAMIHGARVVHVARRGYGSALRAGIAAARGQYIVMGDADDSYDFAQLEPFIVRLRAGQDVVVGNRFQGGIQPGAMPWLHRYIGNPLLSGLLNFFFHTSIHDAHCGMRAFRKEVVERLNLNTTGMEFASEMVVKACMHGLRMSEVPVVLYPDGRGRPPHLRSFRDGWRHLRFLLLLCPLWLYLIPSSLLLAVGFGLMIWPMPGPRAVGHFALDVHTMVLGSLCVILGYQSLWLWAYAKIFAWTSGLIPRETFSLRVLEHISLERGLMLGVALLIAGLGLSLWLVQDWYGDCSGVLNDQATLPYTLWSLTALALGGQTICGSFFLNMLGMTKEEK